MYGTQTAVYPCINNHIHYTACLHAYTQCRHTHRQAYLVSVDFSGISKLHFKFNFLDTELLVQMKMHMDFGVCYMNIHTYLYVCTVCTYAKVKDT